MPPLSQNKRLVSIDSPLGSDAFVVTEFRGEEAISELFSFQLSLLSDNENITPDIILGKAVTLAIHNTDTGSPRYIHGHISRFIALDTQDDGTRRYKAEAVPSLWFTTLGGHNRIFENKDFCQIIEEVLSGYTTISLSKSLSGSYIKRRYTTQFNESDFDFICRLLAEEGVSYYFEHTKGRHLFCIADKASAFKSAIDSAVPYIGAGSNPLKNSITHWQRNYHYHTAEVEYRDYLSFSASEWTKKSIGEKTTNKTITTEKPLKEHFGRLDFEKKEDHINKLTEASARQKARNTILSHEALFDTADGQSTCGEFYAGGQFRLTHTINTETGKYLLTRIKHRCKDNLYRNSFSCQPASIYAPPSPEKYYRAINAPHSAKVIDVKAAAEQGNVDVYTQVKIQFPWQSQQSSCWVQVLQPFAGNNWGASFVPRIGQEVVVEYFNGDPDRPVVTGALYNSDNQGPGYSKSQSGWKSQYEGSQLNEIRLDDKKGSEEIYIEAGKDWNIQVNNDNTETIGNDQNISVKNNRDIQLDKGSEKKEIKQGSQKTTVQGAITIESKSSITLKVGSSTIKLAASGITIKAMDIKTKSSMNTKIEAGTMMDVKGGAITSVKGSLVKVN